MLIHEFMQKDVCHVTLETSFRKCIDQMVKRKVGSVVVIEGKKPINIITESDILQAFCFFNTLDDVTAKDIIAAIKPEEPLITALGTSTYYECYQLILKHGIKHLIITDGENNLIGIVAHADFIKYLNDFTMKDALTGAYTRHFLAFTLDRLIAEKKPFGMLFLDIDRFKLVNDNFGHRTGDLVLKEFSALLRRTLRKTDFVFRYGGDEFVIITPQTSPKEPKKVALKLLHITRHYIFNILGHEIKITFSGGVLSSNEFSLSSEELLELADKGLYAAKHAGRNLICVIRKEGMEYAGQD